MVESKKVVWSKLANNQLKKAFQNIGKDSLQSAKKVKNDILEKAIGIE